MKRIGIALLVLLFTTHVGKTVAQEIGNVTDAMGLKQGYWIVKYDNANPRYEGNFVDDKPIGEFKRFYENGNISALLYYVPANDTVKVQFFHANGFLSAMGNYIDQSREGEWMFYSEYIENYMVMRENYHRNIREGESIKYHWNGNLAEELIFFTDKREGEWRQYYTDGILALRGLYSIGKLNGKFEAFTTAGMPMIRGTYTNDVRDGEWMFWNDDGSFRRKIIYHNGIPENNAQLISEETDLLDEMEKKGGLIEDPAKTGIKW